MIDRCRPSDDEIKEALGQSGMIRVRRGSALELRLICDKRLRLLAGPYGAPFLWFAAAEKVAQSSQQAKQTNRF